MKRVPLALFLAAALSAGCRDAIQPSVTGGPMAVIMDGAHSGNSFFFFLPPLVPNPSSFFHAGKFNAGLAPVVEVCQLTGDPRVLAGADCMDLTRVFGPARMTLDALNQQYQLNWDTKASPLLADKFYRIIVRGAARGKALGFVDVDPVDQGMKNVRTGDVVPFQDGRSLPIKVRIEDGAFGSTNTDDHVERVVPSTIPGGTLDITTNTGFAGARFKDGWLPQGFDQVVVIIERLTPNNDDDKTSCLESGLEELEGCYRFRTDPDLHGLGPRGTDLTFRQDVIAGVCFEFPNLVGHEGAPPFALHRREEVDGVLTGEAVSLPDVDAPFLNCGLFGRSRLSLREALHSGNLGDVASAGWHVLVRGLGRLVTPRALYAVDAGAGGSSNEFSRFGWARDGHLNVTTSIPPIAAAGTDVLITARVTTLHDDVSTSVAGAPVTFTITGGGGSLDVGTANTNADGVASVHWRTGTIPGLNTIEVKTAHVLEGPITAATLAFGGLVDFETLPNGTPACEQCAVTNQFSSRGIVFSGNVVQLFNSSTYDPPAEPGNHSVTPGTGGTTRLTFPGAPTTVNFRARVNNGIPPVGIRAFTPGGSPISTDNISVITLGTYLNATGTEFRSQAVSISDAGGVGYFEFENTVPTDFFYIMDNFQLGYGTLSQYACTLEPSLRSIEGTVPTSIRFVNQTAGPVKVYWIDYEGHRVLYNGALGAEQSYDQQTWLTHPWVVTDATGACLGIWLPSAALGTASIGGDAPLF